MNSGLVEVEVAPERAEEEAEPEAEPVEVKFYALKDGYGEIIVKADTNEFLKSNKLFTTKRQVYEGHLQEEVEVAPEQGEEEAAAEAELVEVEVEVEVAPEQGEEEAATEAEPVEVEVEVEVEVAPERAEEEAEPEAEPVEVKFYALKNGYGEINVKADTNEFLKSNKLFTTKRQVYEGHLQEEVEVAPERAEEEAEPEAEPVEVKFYALKDGYGEIIVKADSNEFLKSNKLFTTKRQVYDRHLQAEVEVAPEQGEEEAAAEAGLVEVEVKFQALKDGYGREKVKSDSYECLKCNKLSVAERQVYESRLQVEVEVEVAAEVAAVAAEAVAV
ncbi:unnamed protein product [Heligmosomoides polygyrus]|uniref:Major latex allergen Hev b 5-like n=1 Tax=Heligmosomoides polygyrus TaxID=6339 RepID=A0A183GJL9_HELPZ|nr:unnamed protein product [Heligmosomoides polygyrus]